MTHKFSNASLSPGPYDATRDGGHAFSVDGSDHSWFCADGKKISLDCFDCCRHGEAFKGPLHSQHTLICNHYFSCMRGLCFDGHWL